MCLRGHVAYYRRIPVGGGALPAYPSVHTALWELKAELGSRPLDFVLGVWEAEGRANPNFCLLTAGIGSLLDYLGFYSIDFSQLISE